MKSPSMIKMQTFLTILQILPLRVTHQEVEEEVAEVEEVAIEGVVKMDLVVAVDIAEEEVVMDMTKEEEVIKTGEKLEKIHLLEPLATAEEVIADIEEEEGKILVKGSSCIQIL